MRKSKEYRKIESEWIGKKVTYFLQDVRDRKSSGGKLDGPFTGTVEGCSNNEAMIEDRLEGFNHRNSVASTGSLFVKDDDTFQIYDAAIIHCTPNAPMSLQGSERTQMSDVKVINEDGTEYGFGENLGAEPKVDSQLAGSKKYNFVAFTQTTPKRKNPYPVSMKVGQVVERCPCSRTQRSQLKGQMRRLLKLGYEFSIYEDRERVVIRKDK